MNRAFSSFTLIAAGTVLMIGVSASSRGQDGGSEIPNCNFHVLGNPSYVGSTTKCCINSDCTGFYSYSIVGEQCAPGQSIFQCACTAVSSPIVIATGGICAAPACPGPGGDCVAGTTIAVIPWSYQICSGAPCGGIN